MEKQTEQLMSDMNAQIGMPEIINYYERKMAKEIFELRDDSRLITYAYTQTLEGRFIFIGECVGFGLPYSVQYTNPEKAEYRGYSLPQADPNGLFMPDGLSATWLMYINPDTGNREAIYMEPTITVTQSKLPRRLVSSWSLPGDY